AEEAVKDAAGKVASRGRGQGFQLDQDVKVAVEAHAMNMATEFYAQAWTVEDVHGKESYDLLCRRGDEVRHVEVKGTTTDGAEVILTPNEVRHAQENRCTALFVLSNVKIERDEDGTVIATDGIRHLYDPWCLDDGTLTPLGFRYQVPAHRPGLASAHGRTMTRPGEQYVPGRRACAPSRRSLQPGADCSSYSLDFRGYAAAASQASLMAWISAEVGSLG